jgi:hypothetical protein
MAQVVSYLPETSAIGYEAARSCFPYTTEYVRQTHLCAELCARILSVIVFIMCVQTVMQ